jgi:hydrogenase nickel incorporation protein HypB
MCVVCGCGNADTHGVKKVQEETGTSGMHPGSAMGVQRGGALHFGTQGAQASVPGLSPQRLVKMEADVLGANQRFADANRAHFAAHGVRAVNLMSSPGSGKTTLLCATLSALRQRAPGVQLAVIEGDQQTTLDADRIRATGVAAVQVNTGRGCHLDAQMVSQAFASLDVHALAHGHHQAHPTEAGHHHHDASDHDHDLVHDSVPQSLLMIENVGNLVCPALWDLGEAAKVVVVSVTEGDDKPLKYPDMFASATLLVVNKTDLLPYVSFDVARCVDNARHINPHIQVLQLSATTGEGLAPWLEWLLH